MKKKYIGIRGHRGSGKNTISYLLGQTINFILTSTKLSEEHRKIFYNSMYTHWCEEFIKDESTVLSSRYVYLDSFGDTPKMLVNMLTNIPVEYIYSDYYKDNCVINIGSFEIWMLEDIDTQQVTLSSAKQIIELIKKTPNTNLNDIYMTLREFIIYYATITSMFLGNDVWVKSKRADESRLGELELDDNDKYIIFTDIKAPTEVSYIKEKGGWIIKLERPNHIKSDKGIDALDNDHRIDFTINIDNLFELKDEIYNISKTIIDYEQCTNN